MVEVEDTMMTSTELIKELSKLPANTPLLIASDSEGNRLSQIDRVHLYDRTTKARIRDINWILDRAHAFNDNIDIDEDVIAVIQP